MKFNLKEEILNPCGSGSTFLHFFFLLQRRYERRGFSSRQNPSFTGPILKIKPQMDRFCNTDIFPSVTLWSYSLPLNWSVPESNRTYYNTTGILKSNIESTTTVMHILKMTYQELTKLSIKTCRGNYVRNTGEGRGVQVSIPALGTFLTLFFRSLRLALEGCVINSLWSRLSIPEQN